MINGLKELVSISQYYGRNPEYVIAGGGNTSFKDHEHMWIKASGYSLATITEEGFAQMNRHCLNKIAEKCYSSDPLKREAVIKEELHMCIAGSKDKRPSVETSLHNLLDSAFVVHTHPTLVNALMCSVNSHKDTTLLFGNDALFVEYTDPGYILFKLVQKRIREYKMNFGMEPAIIFLENHGVFVAANTCEEIKTLYNNIYKKLNSRISSPLPSSELHNAGLSNYVNIIMEATGLTAKAYSSDLISSFIENKQAFSHVNKAFTPDNIVYCKAHYLFCETNAESVNEEFLEFKRKHGFFPRIIGVKNQGIICLEENEKSCDTVYEVYQDMLKIAWLAKHFGGVKPMTTEQISFIDNWEVENYRRKIAKKGS